MPKATIELGYHGAWRDIRKEVAAQHRLGLAIGQRGMRAAIEQYDALVIDPDRTAWQAVELFLGQCIELLGIVDIDSIVEAHRVNRRGWAC